MIYDEIVLTLARTLFPNKFNELNHSYGTALFANTRETISPTQYYGRPMLVNNTPLGTP